MVEGGGRLVIAHSWSRMGERNRGPGGDQGGHAEGMWLIGRAGRFAHLRVDRGDRMSEVPGLFNGAWGKFTNGASFIEDKGEKVMAMGFARTCQSFNESPFTRKAQREIP